jgi:hypothetical protein
VLAGPDNGKAAVADGGRRVSPADRDHTLDVLKAAFVQDRLSKDEFDARIGQALTSRTRAELGAVIDDVPAGLVGVRPPRTPPRRMSNAARWGASGLVAPAVLAAAFTLTSLSGGSGFGAVAFVVALGYFIFWLSAGADMLWQWHCMSQPGAGMCVRCAHTAASHRTSVSCAARPGAPGLRRRCPCAGHVPPGVSPPAADLSPVPAQCR